MDSWTLQGDSYSFLRSAPRTFSLCHRDGTPNHVEIFDIINVPTQRSAISETTCLCDIFGDDCESPSLSSSPAVGAFVPPQRDLDGTAAASPVADDLNDSSGSYHTAPGSSEGEEGFEDSRDRISSPLLQIEPSERTQSEGQGPSSGLPEDFQDSSPNLEPKGDSPVPQFASASPTSQVTKTGERTPSPGHSSPYTHSLEGRLSVLSSSSVHNRHSPLSPDPKQEDSEVEQSLSLEDRHQPVSPSTEPTHCVSSPTSDLVLPEDRIARYSPESRSSSVNQINSPSPETTLEDASQDFTKSTFESIAVSSSPAPSPCSIDLLSQSRETLVSPEPRNSSSCNTQSSSPFTELRGRVSLPDLFSRGSTPELKDYIHTPELVSDPSPVERDTTATLETQSTRLTAELDSAVSSPVPRYTPPSPVISVATSPEPVEPELRSTAPSPGLLSAASSAKSETRTPSPDPSSEVRQNSTFRSSSVVTCSLSPSPGVRDNCTPTEHRYTTPSPEIRITASSPEVRRKEQSSNLGTPSVSPLLEPHSASSRSLTSSPHITGISYSVVQPEDRNSPPFPELSHLSTPEPDGTRMSSEPRSLTASRNSTEGKGTPRDSPHTPGPQSEIPQPRYQTPSPQPNPHSPSPEPRYQTPSPVRYQSPSSHHSSRDPSPAASFPGPRYQCSPVSLSTEYIPQNPQTTSPVRKTPEVERESTSLDITEAKFPTVLERESVTPSFQLDRRDTKSCSPVVVVCPPVSISPVFVKEDNFLKQQTTEREKPPNQENFQHRSSVASSPEERQEVCHPFFQREETEIKSPSPNLFVPKDKSPNSSPVHTAASNSPVQRQENHQPQLTNYPLTSENSNLLKSTFTPASTRKQLIPNIRRENRERSTEDMSRHVGRRRTPSPPLTRFTPVHIIAPEKPYRQWQNRSRSPSQVVTSPPSGNLKKAVTNRESTYAADNNSQAHWVRQGRQLEMEREMLLEQQREVDRERQRDRGMERERKRAERVPEKREGDVSYRGEQVELSFSARNRKGPMSRSAAPTSRETRQGLPTVHSYSESLLTPRQLQQHHRLASQQDTRGGSASRRLQHTASQNKNTAPGCVVANRPSQSSSSSMGSELDEADNEVKWFTDLAFRSLSSPEVDYLDMYNSSHRSSTNISQPSTQESPAGVNAAWLAYADFRGSAPKLDHDELSFQQPLAYYPDGLDPARCYELGSFECVDVAVEREDCRKVRRGVPKRQIQLKRKDNAEGKQDESSENSSPGLPGMVESPSQETHSRGTLMRQHSTPAAMQECYPTEVSPEPNQQNERKSKLQKSASMDETCTKTKMATCLIKSVLSKKMQSVDKQPDQHRTSEEVSPTFEENGPPTENVGTKPDTYNLSSSFQSDYSLSSEGFPVRGESCTKDEGKPPKIVGVRSSNRPSSSSSSRSVNFSQTDSEEADSQSRNATPLRSEMRSELKVPFDSKQERTGQADDSKKYEREEGDSANAIAENTMAPSATGYSSMQGGMTNRDQECENTEDHKQLQQSDKGPYMSKTQDVTMKAMEKKKASLNVCLTPEAENKPVSSSPDGREREEGIEINVDTKKEEEESEKVKAPIHKVRDVRRLVKNTYNLSFKAATAVNMNEEKTEVLNEERIEEVTAEEETDVQEKIKREEREEEFWKEEETEEIKDSLTPPLPNKGKYTSAPQPMQIEYKAVCWKEDKNKTTCVKKDSENEGDKAKASSKPVSEVNKESQSMRVHHMTGDAAKCEHERVETQEKEIHKVPDNEKPVVVRTDRKPPLLGSLPKMPSKEREVSTAVVLIREAPTKTKTSQEEIPTPIQAPATPPPSGHTAQGSAPGGHSVSMLLKEKGYQADIGAVVGDPNAAGGKGVTRKHVNSLEIPLQTPSEGGWTESHRERTFSSSSSTCGASAVTEAPTKTREDEGVSITGKDTEKQKGVNLVKNTQEQIPLPTKQKDVGDFESVKRLDPTFPPRSPAIRRFKPQPIEVKSLSKEPAKQDMPSNSAGCNRPQTIEVKSIAKNSQKPVVPPKPSCKFKPADLATNEPQRPSTISTVKAQGEERSQTIVVSSPTIYRKISSDSTSTSNYSRKLAVSAVSSLKPPANKTTATAISTVSNQSAASADTETANDRGHQQPPNVSPQSTRYTQKPITLSTVPTSAAASGLTSGPGPDPGPIPNQIAGSASAGTSQSGREATMDANSQLPYPNAAHPHEQTMSTAPNNTKQSAAVSTTQVPRYTHPPCHRSLSSERTQRTEDLHFYASDDPPSYDERESFSPLPLPDLRSNRYQPSARPPPCSCTAGCPSHPGLIPPHHHRSPHNVTPPAPPHSPGQALPYPVSQAPLRPHQCRPEPQSMSYLPSSPKSSPHGPNQPPTMYQSLHQPAPCPPHPSLMQPCPTDRPLPPPQHIDPRRPPIHRSPHQHAPGMAAASYSDPGHSHSPGLPPIDPQYLCGPQSMGPSYGSEYGGDSSSLYSDSSYGQTPRRVLLDPETGKYFYIEVPVQPLRKMLFDPETGQYVEVLIPQQAMSHSGLYPPSAAPYPPLHNPNMYAPAPQYMPYGAPPPPPPHQAHPQAQPQPPRYPEASAATSMHPSGPGVNYRNPSGQGPKPEPQNHPPLDHSYLESMYYVPTGMNASPNPTPPDYYHKHPPNLPPTGGKRS